MSTICFSDYRHLYRADLANVSDIELLHHEHDEVLQDFTIAHDGTLYFIGLGYSARVIYRTQLKAPGGQCEEHYKHTRNIRRIRARIVNGSSRIYFSSTTESGQDAIFYLSDQNIPVEYYVINPDDIKLYNKCTGEEDWYWYVGDFAFAPDNTLYISNGNSVPCGVYHIPDAGPDQVIGSIERIYYDFEESVQCLASDANYIYCRRALASRIYRIDRGTHQIEFLGDTGEPVSDLCICSASLLGQSAIIKVFAIIYSVYKKFFGWPPSVSRILRSGRS